MLKAVASEMSFKSRANVDNSLFQLLEKLGITFEGVGDDAGQPDAGESAAACAVVSVAGAGYRKR